MSASLTGNSQVANEVRKFVWNINNFAFLSRSRDVVKQHVFPFTIGSSIDKVSKWKFFLAHDTIDKGPALYVQLIEYTGTDQVHFMIEVCIENDTEKFESSETSKQFSACTKAPMKCMFIRYHMDNSGQRALSCLANGEPKIYKLNSIFKKLDSAQLKLKIKFQIFGKYIFTTSGKDSSLSSIMEREKLKSAQRHKEIALAMLENGDWSDVTFATRDDQRIPAHRLILSMQSTVFAAMFSTEMKEKKEGVVKLDDMGAGGLKIFLKFVYTGELEENWGQFYDEIVNAANKYQVQSLIDICHQMLPSLISWKNCFKLLKITELYDMPAAKEKVENFIKSNPDKMLRLLRGSPSSKRARLK